MLITDVNTHRGPKWTLAAVTLLSCRPRGSSPREQGGKRAEEPHAYGAAAHALCDVPAREEPVCVCVRRSVLLCSFTCI